LNGTELDWNWKEKGPERRVSLFTLWLMKIRAVR
jgi:hypothetical protein